MGFFDIWDLINKPKERDPMDPRVQQPMAPEPPPQPMQFDDVPDYGAMLEEDNSPEQEVINAPEILGTEAPETADVFRQYQDWMGRRPDREAFKPSVGRRILGGLAGFLTGMGGNTAQGRDVNRSIVHGKYDEAVSDWESEGKTLGEVGDFAQDIAETRRQREGSVLQYKGGQDRVAATREGIGQRERAEQSQHSDRMANAKTDAEKAAEVKRHNKEMEKIGTERNRIDQIEAGIKKEGVTAYGKDVDTRRMQAEKGKIPKPPSETALRSAIMGQVIEMLKLEKPQLEKHFKRDPKNGSVIWLKKPNQGGYFSSGDTAAEKLELKTFLEEAEKRARLRLSTTTDDPNAVDDYNPLRSEVP